MPASWDEHAPFLRRALDLARRSALEEGSGGPFGAVIALEGRIIGEGRNQVVSRCDPTWRAEMEAIRAASTETVRHFRLSGCVLYASGEPCPMCLSAAYWADIAAIYYITSHADALAHGGFADSDIAAELARPAADRRLRCVQVEAHRAEALDLWAAYRARPGRVAY